MSAAGEKPKVVYVLGAHRSGSTVLGVTLGNCDGFVFAGELHSWLTRHGKASFGGEEGQRLWSGIAAQVPGAEELFGHDTQLYVDRSSALFRAGRRRARRQMIAPYLRIYGDLYRAIASATGASRIVDTSHYPLRAMELQRLQDIELYLLFLVRDPQGIVDSFSARNPDSPSRPALVTNAQLWVTYALCVRAFLRHPRERRMFVRHEDFLRDPAATVSRIVAMTGSDAPVPDLAALRTGSPLQGNRFLKRSDTIALKGPPSKRPPFSLLTAAMQAPLRPVFARLRPTPTSAGDGTR